MYGFVHCCLEDLVLKLFGDEKWHEILEFCKFTDENASFIIHRVYKDEETLKLVGACCKVLGIDLNACLEAFGTHFLHYCQGSGYDRLLRVLGGNLEDFLTNLDYLHEHLASIYPGIHTPSFRCTRGTDGSLLLHYYSDRKGLQSIVVGLVKTIALEFFNSIVTIGDIEEDENDTHIILKIIETKHKNKVDESKLFRAVTESENPRDLFMNVSSFCQAFPFHIIFKTDFYVTQIGQSLQRILKHVWSDKPVKFLDLFLINRPHIEELTYSAIFKNQNATFVVVTLDGILNSQQPHLSIKLKGQMVPVPEADSMMFLCSPRVSGLDEMQELGIYLSDFRLNDFTRDLILMKTARRGERELLEKLEETTNQLKMAEVQLKIDQKKTDELLHSILPHKVVARLRLNLPVPAERFETVTFLFSDIVGFTAMCSHELTNPMDIVRVLNKMYTLFDVLSTMNSVYKVETIGDAYMVVGGVPEYVETHADQVVFMGLGMVAAIQQVLSPVDGQPLKMRVGIHTGPTLAGVVGQQMPRYCLFGNAVTLANKMESNSQPGRINISQESINHLIKDGYKFEKNPIENFPLTCFFVTRPGENFDLQLENEVAEIAEEEKSVERNNEIPVAVIRPAPSVDKSVNEATLHCPVTNYQQTRLSKSINPKQHLENSRLLQFFTSALCRQKSTADCNNPIPILEKINPTTQENAHAHGSNAENDISKSCVPQVRRSNLLCKFHGNQNSFTESSMTSKSFHQKAKGKD
uniref:guanylate cyclase n=1 Tax=Strigamia maritima TaxID=126957 RepID=T1ITQ9_STRMM